MATRVGQASPFLCTLACIESILRDAGRQPPISQSEIANAHPHDCGALEMNWDGSSRFGSVALEKVPSLLLRQRVGKNLRFGLATDVLPEVAHHLLAGGYALLLTTNGGSHCVRALKVDAGREVDIMDPAEGGSFKTWTWEQIEKLKCYAVVVWE